MQGKRQKELIRQIALITTALVVVVADQITKLVVRANLPIGQSLPEEGPFRITYVTNTGGVFGLFANQTFLITIIAIVTTVAILLYFRRLPLRGWLPLIGLGLLLGGTIGNLIDRLYLGSVVDFIDIGVGSYRWPTFNLADTSSVIGVAVLIYYVLFRMGRREPVARRNGRKA